jgi:hypothetical protein
LCDGFITDLTLQKTPELRNERRRDNYVCCEPEEIEMSDTTNETTTPVRPESDRVKFNRRIREKRRKGHDLNMIATYAMGRPVPLDELDLTPEELAEVERVRIERAEREEQARLAAIEQDRREREARKTIVEQAEARAKQATPDQIVEVDSALFDDLATVNILFVTMAFTPRGNGWAWGWRPVISLNFQEAKWWGGWSDEGLEQKLQAVETVAEAWLRSKFPDDVSENTVRGCFEFHVGNRTAVLANLERVTKSIVEGVFEGGSGDFLGIPICEETLLEGVETVEDMYRLLDELPYKHHKELLELATTPELLTALLKDAYKHIGSLVRTENDGYDNSDREPESYENNFGETAYYSQAPNRYVDVEIIGGLGFKESYECVGEVDE